MLVSNPSWFATNERAGMMSVCVPRGAAGGTYTCVNLHVVWLLMSKLAFRALAFLGVSGVGAYAHAPFSTCLQP